MNLEGSLDAFGIADVLALLRGTGKTGVLHVSSGVDVAELALVDGRLASAADQGTGRLGVLRRLVAAGLVDEEPLAWAASEAATTGAGLVRTLIDGDRLAAADAEEVAHDLVLDVLLDVLEWDAGTFAFGVEELATDDCGLRLEPAEAIDAVASRRDVWQDALATTGGFDGVPTCSRSVTDAIQLTPDEWRLAVLADGERSLARICELSGMGRFAVVSAVADLCARGVLNPPADAANDREHLDRITGMLSMLEDVESLHSQASPDEAVPQAAPVAPATREPATAPEPTRAGVGRESRDGDAPDRATVLRLIAGVREL